MGKIKKILENELVGGTQSTDVYPVTSTKAVYDENNETLYKVLKEAEENAGYKPIFRFKALNGISGEETNSTNRISTQFLSTDDFDEISYSPKYTNAQTVYFDTNKVPLTYRKSDVNSQGKTIINKSYKYFKLSVRRVDNGNIEDIPYDSIQFKGITKHSINSDLEPLFQKSDDEPIELNIQGYITKNGSLVNDGSTNWYCSDFIEVDKVDSVFNVNLIGSTTGNVVLIAYYDKSKSILSEYNKIPESILGYVGIPSSSVKYIRFSGASAKFRNYTPYVKPSGFIFYIKEQTDYKVKEYVDQSLSYITGTTSLENIDTESGLIGTNGLDISNGDSNWVRTAYIPLSGVIYIDYYFKSTSSEKLFIAFYRTASQSTFISGKTMSGSSFIKGRIDKSEFPADANFFRCSFASPDFGDYTPKLDIYGISVGGVDSTKISDYTIFPKNIYLVCNSFKNSVYNRNTSPAIYLDHLFKTLNKECNIKFSNGGVKRTFNFKATSDANWNPTLNSSKDVDIFDENIKIVGDIEDMNFDIKVHSTKSTVGKDKIARVLVIGSSTVYGEGATYLSNGIQNVKPYHAICYEFFKKDNIEQGGGNLYFPLGTLKHPNLSFSFKGESYTYDDYHEGRRGQNIQQTIKGTPEFLDENGDFSLKAWLSNYRTLTDKGERLYFGTSKQTTGTAGDNNIGYLEDGSKALDESGLPIYIGKRVSNTLSYNVCTPTHIVYHLGANGGGTQEQYEELIGYAQRDFPEAFIALVMNDSMGTIFPSQYQDADAAKCRWNLTDSRHELCYNIQEVYNHFDTDEYKQQKIYVLPFFFVSNPLFFSVRQSNLPEYDYNGGSTSEHLHPWGWLPTVHADVRAHSNYAYQLYAWIKYTFSL